MILNYQASTRDLKIIEKGVDLAKSEKLRWVFNEKKFLEKTAVTSYDSKYIYLWLDKKFEKIKHQMKINEEVCYYWQAGLIFEALKKYLPKQLFSDKSFRIMSGGMPTTFISLQGKYNPGNPYTYEEGFLASIIHEFAHTYWSRFKLWYFSDKEKNLKYLNTALRLYKNEKVAESDLTMGLPALYGLNEVFAFCAEYTASAILFPKHTKRLDKYLSSRIIKYADYEKGINLDEVDSILEPTIHPHEFSFIVGKILLAKCPKNWHQLLLRFPTFPE